jgi:GDP-L-fucose synthase
MIDKKASVYVAGHRGLTGSAIVNRLRKIGYDNLILKTHTELELRDQKATEAFFRDTRPEYVIVSAAHVGGIMANTSFPADFLYDNLQIQNNILWSAHCYPVKKLLFLGSTCIYPANSPQPMKEEYMLQGAPETTNEAYAIAKIAGIKQCEYLYRQYGDHFISCAPSNLYGPGDNFDPTSSHLVPGIMGRMHKAKKDNAPEFVVWGDGTPRRELLYIDDFAEAAVWMLENYDQSEFLNVGTGKDISVKELAELLKDILGYNGKIVFDSSKPNGVARKLSDVSKIQMLGWHHTVELREGLEKTYEWLLENIT